MVTNNVLDQRGGLWQFLTKAAETYCKRHSMSLESVDVHGRGILVTTKSGQKYVEWTTIAESLNKK